MAYDPDAVKALLDIERRWVCPVDHSPAHCVQCSLAGETRKQLAATIAELEAYRRAVDRAMHELNKGELWDALNTLEYLVHRRHL